MRRVSSFTAVVLLTIGVVTTGCRRPVESAPAPVQPNEEYCWWAVLRSTRAPDSVAARFASAYIHSGFSSVTFKRRADTAWATAAPTPLGGAVLASRAVAYWHGDSTHFRYFVSVGPPAAGTIQATDTSRLVLDLCARVARAAAIGWSAPRSPTGEETLKIWTSIP